MIVDSSAVLAVLIREPGHEPVPPAPSPAPPHGRRRRPHAGQDRDRPHRPNGQHRTYAAPRFLQEAEIAVLPFGGQHWGVAVDAFARYGRGRHPAALSFGDCLTYATARLARMRLLCPGDDFARTDIDLVPRR